MYRVGLFQFRPRFGKPSQNLERILEAIQGLEADLVVLPELPFTGYLFQDRDEVEARAEEPAKSAAIEALVDACRRGGFHLVTGFLEREGHRCFNASLLLGPRGVLQTYRKIHLFNQEKEWFDPGNLPPAIRRVRGVRLGMLICFDYIFPEITRTLALQGMDLLCHPSNLVLKEYGQRSMLTRCLENGIFAVTCNRCGEDRRPHGRLRFTGQSQVAGPRGDRLYRAPAARAAVHVEAVDPARARDKMVTERNHLLEDRRPEFYTTG
jgi:predicted amidohydrolase